MRKEAGEIDSLAIVLGPFLHRIEERLTG